MHRPENDTAAVRLIEQVWPMVIQKVPDARLRIVGANPSAHLIQVAARAVRVEVLGYVQNIEAEYDRSLVAFATLWSGAGVKFKTIDALLSGCAVIGTTIGVEGIGDESWFWSVSNSPEALAEATIDAFCNPEEARKLASASAEVARGFYAQKAQYAAMAELYDL
ncbi:glycosyltransferase family 4 protein [Microbacterium horticulturae]|uniref:Glycosyltransferase family 4 protein n=1 Tax=Microbacterium horticulturae TaxID=3028316 RepID=A0ABY8C2L8_9MICO|nr:glycosyltransferase family 4 protein [Microbacterium sp. KACC 23027]WEG10709.1 glycosyltransferase family 4 protein [Microbacterium sp. KACC 23027]